MASPSRVSLPDAGSSAYTAGTRAARPPSAQKPVSVIPSGPKIRSAKNSSRPWPDTTSTRRPSTSVATEYIQRVPGVYTSGIAAHRSQRAARPALAHPGSSSAARYSASTGCT